MKPVFILGMPHSGAEGEARKLSREGVRFGQEDEFTGYAPDFPDGAFELRSLSNFNRRYLSAFQMNVVSSASLPSQWQDYPQGEALLRELCPLLEARQGLSVPGAALLLPVYQEAFRRLEASPSWIVCVRNPAYFVASTLRWSSDRPAMPPLGRYAIGLWLRYTLDAIRDTDPSNLKVVALESFPEEDLSAYPSLVRETWDACRELAAGNAPMPKLQALARQFDQWRAMLAPPAPPGTQAGFGWPEGGLFRTAQAPFLPTGGWQTLRIAVPAPPNTLVSGPIYGQPCRIWIRRCLWHSEKGSDPAKIAAGPGSILSQAGNLLRLDAAFESRQVSVRTPLFPGPYEFEIEFLLETGPQINVETANRLSERLHRCLEAQRGRS